MENIKERNETKNKFVIFERIVISLLKKFTKGELKLELPDGRRILIGDEAGLQVNLKISNPDFFRKVVFYGDIGFGESYCDGDWTTNDLTKLIRWVIQNVENSSVLSGSKSKSIAVNLLGQLNKFSHYFNKNTKTGSKKNISYHYDLSNDFYKLMLDETMSYSCGIHTEGASLKQAQENKLQKLCEDLDIKESDHILEIGCGWGGFAVYAATKYGCSITGVTISKEQYEFAKNKVSELNLSDKITILLKDYRDLNQKFDKVVSVEMIEAVGDEFLPQYFETIDKVLNPSGVAVIQAITSPDSRYDSFKRGTDFIQKHIFPGSLLPSIRSMVDACKNTSLHLHNLRDIGQHYAVTLKTWEENINTNKEKIKDIMHDDTFFNKWKYYLNYCEAAFIERNISDVQVTFIKPNNTDYKSFEM